VRKTIKKFQSTTHKNGEETVYVVVTANLIAIKTIAKIYTYLTLLFNNLSGKFVCDFKDINSGG